MTFKKRINTLISKLETLIPEKLPSDGFFRTNFYPFSNERGISTPIGVLSNTQPAQVPQNTIRVAILVGQSSFCSLLAKLSEHCELAVFTDVNPYFRQHTQKVQQLLQTTNSRNEFESQYAEYIKGFPLHFTPSQVQPDLAMRKATLQSDHFLYSDQNFEAAHLAAQKLHFAYSNVNLFNADSRKSFFSCFTRRKCEITFINLTNLYEWDANISLAKLKNKEQWHPKKQLKFITNLMTKYHPMIMFSTRENAVESCPLVMQVRFTFADYFRINEQAAHAYLMARFPTLPMLDFASPTPELSAQFEVSPTPEITPDSEISSVSEVPAAAPPVSSLNHMLQQYFQAENNPCHEELIITDNKTFTPYQKQVIHAENPVKVEPKLLDSPSKRTVLRNNLT